MIIKKYNTNLSSNDIFIRIKDQKNVTFLDSAKDAKNLGRYSILVCNPRLIIKSKGEKIYIDNKEIKETNPFESLQVLIDKYKKDYTSDLPIIGVSVGYLSYDLKRFIEELDITTKDDVNIPDMYFGLYDGGIIYDHLKNEVYLTDSEIDEKGNDRIKKIITLLESDVLDVVLKKHTSLSQIESNFNEDDYKTAINKVRDYIKSGDIYQANMTQRFTASLRETPFELYEKLRSINPAPFASYIDFDDGHIVSSSPERFIKITDGVIETRPIKGTRPRSDDKELDDKYINELINSEKDKSELLMIVDLVRNDLSRVAQTGSVEVTELFKLETYATVHHLVATVKATIDNKYSITDCIKASFPGGSITGAPKIRAMEVIDELEPTSRNIYTGSIGYIDLNQNIDLNIVIRTFVCKDDKAYFQAGGGIVWDSDASDEYQESLDKAFALKKALNFGVEYKR